MVLPPREDFSPDSAGAIGLLVHSMARATGSVVVGHKVARPFADVPFHPAAPGFGLSGLSRYAAGVRRVLARLKPPLVEVHNRPEVALRLARRGGTPVTLFLNNDPVGMRGATTAAERAALLDRLALVAGSSGLAAAAAAGRAGPGRPAAGGVP